MYANAISYEGKRKDENSKKRWKRCPCINNDKKKETRTHHKKSGRCGRIHNRNVKKLHVFLEK